MWVSVPPCKVSISALWAAIVTLSSACTCDNITTIFAKVIVIMYAFYYVHCTLLPVGWSTHALGSKLQVQCQVYFFKGCKSAVLTDVLVWFSLHAIILVTGGKLVATAYLLVAAHMRCIWQTLPCSSCLGTPRCIVALTNNGCLDSQCGAIWEPV